MITTVTTKNMISIPSVVGRHFGIRPGFQLDWEPISGSDEIRVRVLPDRAERARRLAGTGRAVAPKRDAVSELVVEREQEG